MVRGSSPAPSNLPQTFYDFPDVGFPDFDFCVVTVSQGSKFVFLHSFLFLPSSLPSSSFFPFSLCLPLSLPSLYELVNPSMYGKRARQIWNRVSSIQGIVNCQFNSFWPFFRKNHDLPIQKKILMEDTLIWKLRFESVFNSEI